MRNKMYRYNDTDLYLEFKIDYSESLKGRIQG